MRNHVQVCLRGRTLEKFYHLSLLRAVPRAERVMMSKNRTLNRTTGGLLLVLAAVLCFHYFFVIGDQFHLNWTQESDSDPDGERAFLSFGGKNELDGCFHVYLDLGSNVGVQVRKLFEPEKYPNAPVLEIFNRFFGQLDEKGHFKEKVCAVGFEPNPHHTAKLKAIEQAYQQCGHNVNFYTETGVSHKYGEALFLTDGDMTNLEWGGKIVSAEEGKDKKGIPVHMVRMTDFIKFKLLTRKIPSSSTDPNAKPKVVMKIDIEGSELEVFTDLLLSGSLHFIDLAFIEWHPLSFKGTLRKNQLERLSQVATFLSDLSQDLNLLSKFKIEIFDDETYGTSNLTLPKCD